MDYVANPAQLITATLVGFVVLLFLIIKLRLHALLSVLIAGVIIGVGSGMPFSLVTQAVTDGMGNTLKGIALIVGLGSMFGGILEVDQGGEVGVPVADHQVEGNDRNDGLGQRQDDLEEKAPIAAAID